MCRFFAGNLSCAFSLIEKARVWGSFSEVIAYLLWKSLTKTELTQRRQKVHNRKGGNQPHLEDQLSEFIPSSTDQFTLRPAILFPIQGYKVGKDHSTIFVATVFKYVHNE